MKLASFLAEARISEVEFAASVGQTARAVESWLAGTRRPRWETLAQIVEVTDGKVTANDFLADPSANSYPEQPEAAE